MKRWIAVMLLAVFALAMPGSVRAQADNDAARTAVEKHNARQSRKQIRARDRAIRRSQRAMAKRARSQKARRTHSQNTPY